MDPLEPVDCCDVAVETMLEPIDEEEMLGWVDSEVIVDDTPDGADCPVAVAIDTVELSEASDETVEGPEAAVGDSLASVEETLEGKLELAEGCEETILEIVEED